MRRIIIKLTGSKLSVSFELHAAKNTGNSRSGAELLWKRYLQRKEKSQQAGRHHAYIKAAPRFCGAVFYASMPSSHCTETSKTFASTTIS